MGSRYSGTRKSLLCTFTTMPDETIVMDVLQKYA
jgi:hypothetical protein